MNKFAALTLSLFLVCGTALADTPKDSDAPAAKPKPAATAKPAAEKSSAEIAAEVEALRQALQVQQEELQLLKEELAKRDRQIDAAREEAAAANSKAADASSKATEAVAASTAAATSTEALSSSVSALKTSNDTLFTTVNNANSGASQLANSDDGPVAIRYKGISITPGGFLAGETVFRNHATGGGIATPLTGIPFEANDLAHTNENSFDGRQSRLSMLAQGKLASATLAGYVEADFLGAGTTSNNRQTNSYVFRQRQLFAQVAFNNGWIITGGQQWSLAMENKKGEFNRQENTPMQIDPNYIVGMTWARQYGFRVVKDFGGKFALGMSVEGPQATIGGRGFSTVTTVNDTAAASTILTSGATTATTGNFFLNAPGQGSGLQNAFDSTGYTVNKAPDLIFKAAADPGWGHYEVFGIVSFFKDRIYPCGVVGTNAGDSSYIAGVSTLTDLTCTVGGTTYTTVSSLGATNTSTTGGGVGASFNVPLFNKKLEVGLKAVAGDGIGRYGDSQLADATARPDGTLSLIRTAHGLARAEWHATPKLDLYALWGAEYAWRAGYKGYNSISITKTPAISYNTTVGGVTTTTTIPATTTTKFTLDSIGGYGNVAANDSGCATEGVPTNDFNPSTGANCAGDIRVIQEPTVGFWYKFYQGPKGRFQFGVQYSYLTKDAWSGVTEGVAYHPKGVDNMLFTSFRYYLP
jgi:Skp family chaperone for outer membrane proteins